MKKFLSLLFASAAACTIHAQTVQQIEANRTMLPNGWAITKIGNSLQLGDLPLNIAVSKSKKLLAVTNNGQSVQSIQLIDPVSEKILDEQTIPKSWYGLKFSNDEKSLYE